MHIPHAKSAFLLHDQPRIENEKDSGKYRSLEPMGQDNPTTDIDEGSLLLSIIVPRSWRKKIAIKSQKSLMR
jgi:hypothetical protein